MNPSRSSTGSGLAAKVAIIVCSLSSLVASAGPAADQGLVTLVRGQATCRGQDAQAPIQVVPFMKLRTGDRLELTAESKLRTVYFKTGRLETWTGPARFRIGVGSSLALGKAAPQVSAVPARASQEVRQIPDILKKRLKLTKSGSGIQRSSGQAQPHRTPVELSIPEQQEIQQAHETYRKLRAQLPDDDITPELILIGVLWVYEQHQAAAEVVVLACKRQPDNPNLAELEKIINDYAGSEP